MIRSSSLVLALAALALGSCSQSSEPVAAAGPRAQAEGPSSTAQPKTSEAEAFTQAPLAEAPILAGTVTFGGELAQLTEGTVMIMASSDLGAMFARRFDLAPTSPEYGPGLGEDGLPFRLGELDTISGQAAGLCASTTIRTATRGRPRTWHAAPSRRWREMSS